MPQQYAKDQPAGFQNLAQNIAIVGATGSVGSHILQHLLQTKKHKITAITREDSKSKMPDGVNHVAKVNYDDHASLVQALKGQDALIISMKTGQVEQSKKLVRAAAEAKVAYIVPNEYCPDVLADEKMGQDSGLLGAVKEVKDEIEKLGVSARIGFVCGFWYEFSLAVSPYAYGFDIANKKVTFFDDGNTKINTSTWQQCGAAAAALFSLPILAQDESDKGPYLDMWRKKDLHIESFFVSQRDMLASILRVTGDKESDWTIDSEPSVQRWNDGAEYLKGSDFARGYMTCMYTRVFYQDGSGDFRVKLDNEKLGLPKESQDEASKRAVDMVNEGYNYFARG